MQMLRNHTFVRVFSLFTGLIFLNMSFFLAEVCMLNLKDKQMIENVCNLVINAGMEEERDGHSSGADVSLKEFAFIEESLMLKHSSLVLIACKIHHEYEDHYLHADHSIKFSPPPEGVTFHS